MKKPEIRSVPVSALRPGMEVVYREYDHEYPGTVLDIEGDVVWFRPDRPLHYMDAPLNKIAQLVGKDHVLPESRALFRDAHHMLLQAGVLPAGEWTVGERGVDLYALAEPVPLERIVDHCVADRRDDFCWLQAATLSVVPVDTRGALIGRPGWFAGPAGTKEWRPTMGIALPEDRTFSACRAYSAARGGGEGTIAINGVVTDEITQGTISIFIPVVGKTIMPASTHWAGRAPAEDVVQVFEEAVLRIPGTRSECIRGARRDAVAKFMVAPLEDVSVPKKPIAQARKELREILEQAFA